MTQETHRNVVDGLRIERFDNAVGTDVTAHRQFLFKCFRQCHLASRYDHLRSDTDATKFLNGVLRRFGLELTCSFYKRNECDMYEESARDLLVVFHLTDRFHKRQSLDIADRPSKLDDEYVMSLARFFDA